MNLSHAVITLSVFMVLLPASSLPIRASDSDNKNHKSEPSHTQQIHFASARDEALYFIKPIFHTLDCEGVGVVEPDEISEHFAQVYFYHDLDRSRKINREEFIATMPKGHMQQNMYLFGRLDENRDEHISTREYKNYVFRAIQIADINNDGELTELEAGFEPRKKKSAKSTRRTTDIIFLDQYRNRKNSPTNTK